MDIFENNVDVNKYRVFLVVAEFKSFSKAAEYMHISQPAISHAIKELESRLRGRNTESEADIQKRLAFIKLEIENSKNFDYEVINDSVENAVKQLEKIMNL